MGLPFRTSFLLSLFGIVASTVFACESALADPPAPKARVAASDDGAVPPPKEPDTRALEEHIRAEFLKPTVVEFDETPLAEAIRFLEAAHGVKILLDEQALNNAGLSGDVPVSAHLSGLSLRSTLRSLIRPLRLSYVVDNGYILITTRQVARTMLSKQLLAAIDLDGQPGDAWTLNKSHLYAGGAS